MLIHVILWLHRVGVSIGCMCGYQLCVFVVCLCFCLVYVVVFGFSFNCGCLLLVFDCVDCLFALQRVLVINSVG